MRLCCGPVVDTVWRHFPLPLIEPRFTTQTAAARLSDLQRLVEAEVAMGRWTTRRLETLLCTLTPRADAGVVLWPIGDRPASLRLSRERR